MNCVIAFFPFRFIAMALGASTRLGADGLSKPAAALFVGVCMQQMHWARGMTDGFHHNFPTGRARIGSLTPIEIALYVGLPGLYPLPTLLVILLKRCWGHVPSMYPLAACSL